jgi:hypothetical protein
MYIDIDIDDLYSELSNREKQQLAEWLEEDGYCSIDPFSEETTPKCITDWEWKTLVLNKISNRTNLPIHIEQALFEIAKKL